MGARGEAVTAVSREEVRWGAAGARPGVPRGAGLRRARAALARIGEHTDHVGASADARSFRGVLEDKDEPRSLRLHGGGELGPCAVAWEGGCRHKERAHGWVERGGARERRAHALGQVAPHWERGVERDHLPEAPPRVLCDLGEGRDQGLVSRRRSEEHTPELQSRRDLVCRLLLEKKKK